MRSIARSRSLVRVAVILMAIFVLGSGMAIWLLREGAIKDTEDDNHRLGVVLAEQAVRTFQAADFVLQEMTDKVASSNIKTTAELRDKLGGRDVYDALTRRLVDLPQVEAFTILDASGDIVNVTRQWPAPGYSLAERAYFKYFAATPDPSVYVSEPGISLSTGARTVFLARRLTGADGAFAGVVVAPIRLDYFDALFAKTGFTDGTGITIVRRDGFILVHFPNAKVQPGQHIPKQLGWYETVARGGCHYLSPGAFDDLGAALVSVHPVAPYPIVVDVARSQAAALARWRQQATAISAGMLAAMISLALLLRAFARQIRLIKISQEQIGAQLTVIQASEARLAAQSTLLKTTLEHMDQGLLMVDAAGIVGVWNQRAIDMLDLDAEMMTGHPRLTDVVDYQIKRGDFTLHQSAPIDPAMLLDAEAAYEHRRPDNMILEVRSTPLPEGGFVRTYTDVSARAAAEAMLGRAALQDQLTGLANPHFSHDILKRAISFR